MRLVKLSTTEFADEDDLRDYFDNKLFKRSPKGLFIFGKQIAPNGIEPGETILFSYRNRLRYVTKAKTGRMENTYREKANYPNCFVIEMPVRKTNASLEKVGQKLRTEAGLKKSLKGQGWTIIPDSNQAKKVIEDLTFANTSTLSANDVPDGLPAKIKLIVNRFIRDTKTSRQIKELYKFKCQICGKRLKIRPGVFYAETHHLQPLGGEHKGPDVRDNILCLCPNHHALFDYFAIPLDPANLLLNKHDLRQSFVDYHNAHSR